MTGKKYILKPKTAPGLEANHGPLSANSTASGNPTVHTPYRKAKKAK
jgi:hypothetical protein